MCDRRSHVVTVANPHSPYLGCCALCGKATAQLVDMLAYAGEQHVRQLLERAIQINAGRLSVIRAKRIAL
jgi:hypothetical protein